MCIFHREKDLLNVYKTILLGGIIKNIILTASSNRHGDFLINHWLRSLKDNVTLHNVDIVVLDYGLSQLQESKLIKKGVITFKCKKDARVNNIRLRDAVSYLENHNYDQVLTTDGGDIIFQTDISKLFQKNKKSIRVVCEESAISFVDYFLRGTFYDQYTEDIQKQLARKKMVNVGFILGPLQAIKKLFSDCYDLIKDKNKWGAEQIGINYLLYEDGFTKLDSGYNFIPATAKNKFYIKKGVFYYKDGQKIPVVHNAGGVSAWRTIKKFGYGPKYNKLKKLTLYGEKGLYRFLNFIKQLLFRRYKN